MAQTNLDFVARSPPQAFTYRASSLAYLLIISRFQKTNQTVSPQRLHHQEKSASPQPETRNRHRTSRRAHMSFFACQRKAHGCLSLRQDRACSRLYFRFRAVNGHGSGRAGESCMSLRLTKREAEIPASAAATVCDGSWTSNESMVSTVPTGRATPSQYS